LTPRADGCTMRGVHDGAHVATNAVRCHYLLLQRHRSDHGLV
jgi:hypothetical protein